MTGVQTCALPICFPVTILILFVVCVWFSVCIGILLIMILRFVVRVCCLFKLIVFVLGLVKSVQGMSVGLNDLLLFSRLVIVSLFCFVVVCVSWMLLFMLFVVYMFVIGVVSWLLMISVLWGVWVS